MTYDLVITPGAEADLNDSSQWYEKQQQGLGTRFIDNVEAKLITILRNPANYQIRYKEIRMALIKDFPFAIHFILKENKIVVVAILSTSRKPGSWNRKT